MGTKIIFCLFCVTSILLSLTGNFSLAFAQLDDKQTTSVPETNVPALAPEESTTTPQPASGGVMLEQPNPVTYPQTSTTSAQTTVPTNISSNTTEEPIFDSTESSEQVSTKEMSDGVKVDKKRISLDLKGIDIIELFRILSLKMGVTIVPSKSVSGRVSIFLNNLTFEDALDVLLLSQDLACEKRENIINIMTSGEYERLYGRKYNEKRQFKTIKLSYAKPSAVFNALGQIKSDIGKIIVDEATGTIFLIDTPEKLKLMEKTIEDLDQVPQTEIFDIKYAKPAELKTHLSGAITTGPGELFVDERSNKVIVSDLPEKIRKIKRMVKALDESSRQVFIEAEIVQITLKDEYQRGINWEKIFRERSWDDLDFKGTFPISPSFTPSPALSVANLKMAVGTLAADNYTTTLQLLQTFGDAKILSRPRIAVINNQEAKILVGAREAYVTQSLSQADTSTVTTESIQFIDVGVKLNVVPTINTEGFVTMKIKPEVSSVRETITTSLGSRIPIVETSEAETVVKVKDGTMIMIAGLMKEDKREDVSGIPILSRIPVLGAAFGSRAGSKKKTELVIFITPHIISGETQVAGTEPEKLIPPDITPEDMIESLVSEKVSEIKLSPQDEKLLGEEMRKLKQAPISKESAPAKKEKADIDIEEKIKGIKKF